MSVEIDTRIAIEIMGYNRGLDDCSPEEQVYPCIWIYENELILDRAYNDRSVFFSPSTRVQDAWQVVEKFIAGGYSFQLHYDHNYGVDKRSGWSVSIDGSTMIIFVSSAPEAICLAVLKWQEYRK